MKLMLSLFLSLNFFTLPAFAVRRTFSENRSYVYVLYTPEQCEEYRRQGYWGNCSQTMDFTPEGRVTVMVTDIMNPGTYWIENDKVHFEMGPGDVPPRFILTLGKNESSLIESNGKTWLRE